MVERKRLKLWAGIYGATNEQIISRLTSKECDHGFPHGLSRFRELLRVSSGRVLPKALSFYPDWQGTRFEAATGGDVDNGIFTIGGMKPVRDEFFGEQQTQLSLSTKIVENSPMAMFHLGLMVETKDGK